MANLNNLFRKHFIKDIRRAIEDADDAKDIQHSGLAGEIREILLSKLLEPVLPPEVKCGTGKLIDFEGKLSKQIDVILYSKNILPPVLLDKTKGIFPVESCLYTLEVKSTVTSQSLKEAIENAKSTHLNLLSTERWIGDEKIETGIPAPINALFGFSSDLSGDGKTELDRYRELDPNANESPAIRVICVRGKGYWYFYGQHGVTWKFSKPDKDFDEVLVFLSGTVNTIPEILSKKGRPKFGRYLSLGSGEFKNV